MMLLVGWKRQGPSLRRKSSCFKKEVKRQNKVIDRLADSTPSGSTKSSGASLPHPDKFTGQEKDTAKRTMEFQAWRGQVTARWKLRKSDFPTEAMRILYVQTMLGGAAYNAVRVDLAVVAENEDDDTKWAWKTGEAPPGCTDSAGKTARI
jgi:hypothetical protein